eukprot:TRINITY_DN63366_c0_g1_i1.p1 TRINITY_DN63366_c0_g1~~TRINITY_DN63366_c0_g1_i1.p1  ORF type:complete len:567 (+),score=65.36 TRINITY_DN63366_c0_g1_i1:53-1753(+)
MTKMLSLLICLLFVGTMSAKPNIVFIVADDLGYNDLGITNGHKTITPNINGLIQDGIELTHYYTYKVCAPSRASIMTGRYPWGIGYFDMHGPEAPPLDYKLLPQLLKPHGYNTHAIGKWDLGYWLKQLTPTYRGFDTFAGYYEAALADYWYHWAGACKKHQGYDVFDLSNTTGKNIQGWQGVNGTYDQELFTREAVRHIHNAADSGEPFFMYLAYQNVHAAGDAGPIQAPCSLIDDLYSTTEQDTYKAQGGMLTELDYGVGNVTRALKQTGLDNNTVIILVSDNGGPLAHSTNAPLRGGKHTFWEGGLRVVSFVWSGSTKIVPSSKRGTRWGGMAHSSDWYKTITEGMIGITVPNNTGSRPSDGLNLWPAILAGDPSPRHTVVHQISSPIMQAVLNEDITAIRWGDYKLLVGDKIGDTRIVSWPETGRRIPFGRSGGMHEQGTDHCRAPKFKPKKIEKDCSKGCMYNVETDPGETTNLVDDPKYKDKLTHLYHLAYEAAQGAPAGWAWPCSNPIARMMGREMCETGGKNPSYPFIVPTLEYCQVGTDIIDGNSTAGRWEFHELEED